MRLRRFLDLLSSMEHISMIVPSLSFLWDRLIKIDNVNVQLAAVIFYSLSMHARHFVGIALPATVWERKLRKPEMTNRTD